jgi:metal iron transporter
MIVIISKIDVNWGKAFEGFLPSKYVFAPGALYTCMLECFLVSARILIICVMVAVGILGATVMPHSLFLGSALATQNRVSSAPKSGYLLSPSSDSSKSSSQTTIYRPLSRYQRAIHVIKEFLITPFRTPPASAYSTRAQRHEDRENNSFEFIKAHIYHGTVDMMISLLGFAVMINALLVGLLLLPVDSPVDIGMYRILILAGAVFYYGAGVNASPGGPASLFDAYDLIKELVGQGALLWPLLVIS